MRRLERSLALCRPLSRSLAPARSSGRRVEQAALVQVPRCMWLAGRSLGQQRRRVHCWASSLLSGDTWGASRLIREAMNLRVDKIKPSGASNATSPSAGVCVVIRRFSQQEQDLGVSTSSPENRCVLTRVVQEAAFAPHSSGLSLQRCSADPAGCLLPTVADSAFPPRSVTSVGQGLSADIIDHPRLQIGERHVVSRPGSGSLPSGAVPWCPPSAAWTTASPVGPGTGRRGALGVATRWGRTDRSHRIGNSPQRRAEKTSRTLRGTVRRTPLDARPARRVRPAPLAVACGPATTGPQRAAAGAGRTRRAAPRAPRCALGSPVKSAVLALRGCVICSFPVHIRARTYTYLPPHTQ